MAITNLYVTYAYKSGGTNLPVVLLMHGFSQEAASFGGASLARIAERGLFVAAVGMRGRDSADGTHDASAREIYDIYDALTYIRANYAGIVSQTYAVIAGYSGGGGNALAAACKFPDTFAMVVSHFGMSDYGVDAVDGWYNNGAGGTNQGLMQTWIGGTPAIVPNAYRARNAVEAIATNYTAGHLYLYHDSGDTSVPIVNSQNVGAAMLAAGLANFTENYTGPGDDPRWTHGLPGDVPDLEYAEDIWAEAAAARTHAIWTVPTSGTVRVIGYIVTKRFSVWLGTTTEAGAGGGLDEVADVVYDTATDTYTVTPLTGACHVFVEQGAKTGTASGITVETEIVVT